MVGKDGRTDVLRWKATELAEGHGGESKGWRGTTRDLSRDPGLRGIAAGSMSDNTADDLTELPIDSSSGNGAGNKGSPKARVPPSCARIATCNMQAGHGRAAYNLQAVAKEAREKHLDIERRMERLSDGLVRMRQFTTQISSPLPSSQGS